MGSICSDRPRDSSRLPRYIKERRAEMWRWGEKEEDEVGGGIEGGREEGGRGKIGELSNSLPQVPLECEV